MLSFEDVLDRIEQGPICTERDFDLRVLHPKLQEVIREHDIRFDPDNPISSDDGLADEIFKAALELYLHTGTLCVDNNRRALFQESEIKDSLRALPRTLLFGEGADQHEMVCRRVEDHREPFCMSESIGHPVSEENYLPVIMSYAQNPLADAAGVASTTTIHGRPIRARSPTEVTAAIWNVLCFRQATKMVGRLGLGSIDLIGNAESTTAIIAATNPDFGARKTDGFAVAGLPELKVDYERLNKTAYFLRTGHLICSLAPGPIKGGLAGGPEGTAILSVANLFQGTVAIRGQYYVFFPHDMRFFCNSSREMLWTASIAGQAISRNTHALKLISPYSAAGPCTEMVAYEEAAECLAIVTSGADVDYGSVAKNKYLDYCSGLEAQFAHEVCHAAAGMKRNYANILTKEILKRYESKMQDPPLGKKFQDCYDVRKVTPSKEYVDLHSRIRKELTDIGLNTT